MGIRGLTTFISEYSDKFLQRHELHNTYLVLDGNNICCQLFIWHTKSLGCFGGDYDTFARMIEKFFGALAKCNVTPIVVFDGNYERKKLKTILARQKDRIKTAGRLTPGTERTCSVFPLFARVMFAEIVRRLNLYIYRCELEADNELACLARALNCPVLSYDSDFYIFDVLYVPFNSLNIVPCFNRLTKTWYLDCNLYKIEHFLKAFPGLQREHLPLIATLLGNDYIKASVFRQFYSQLKLQRCKSGVNVQQRRIRTVIQWLRTETIESAVRKILGRLKTDQRKRVAGSIDIIVQGYICCDSVVLRDLNISICKPIEPLHKFDLKNYNIDDLLIEENCEGSESEGSESDASVKEISAVLNIHEEQEIINDKAISANISIPSWFVKNHNFCVYPSLIYEIAQGLLFFFTPQIEDYNNKPSHSICFNILSAMNKLLTQTIYNGKEQALVVLGRNDSNGMIRFSLPPFNGDVLSLHAIPKLAKDARLNFMLKILDCKNVIFDGIPDDWKLLMICVIFWIKNATVKINSSHTFSVYMCCIVLKIIDSKIGVFRNLTRLRSKWSKLLLENTNNTVLNSTSHLNLKNITNSESAQTMSKLISDFHLNEKIARNNRLFDIRIVDAFAQLQCCIFYISAFNSLLNEPLESLIISDFYNGTFLYNLCANLNKRNDIVGYLKQLLPNSPNIINCCVKLEEIVNNSVGGKFNEVISKKKRKKNKQNKNEKEVVEVEEIVNNLREVFVDENNAYSILSNIS